MYLLFKMIGYEQIQLKRLQKIQKKTFIIIDRGLDYKVKVFWCMSTGLTGLKQTFVYVKSFYFDCCPFLGWMVFMVFEEGMRNQDSLNKFEIPPLPDGSIEGTHDWKCWDVLGFLKRPVIWGNGARKCHLSQGNDEVHYPEKHEQQKDFKWNCVPGK